MISRGGGQLVYILESECGVMRMRVLMMGMVLGMGVVVCGAGEIVKDGEKIEKVRGGFRFTEGPAFDGKGAIYFTDIPNSRIMKYEIKAGKMSVFREKSGRANGLMFDGKGRLVMCEGGNRQVTRMGSGGKIEVLASKYKGKKLNSPNDLDIDDKGGIYFTDPRYGNRSNMEMKVEGVYYIKPGGGVVRLIDQLKRPNGIILSLDGKTLYVVDNGTRDVWSYPVKGGGDLGNGKVFAKLDAARGGGDGMSIDSRGNIYCAGQGHVYAWDKSGKKIAKIKFPEGPANCTFAGKGSDVLYVTARKGFYRLKLNAKGGK